MHLFRTEPFPFPSCCFSGPLPPYFSHEKSVCVCLFTRTISLRFAVFLTPRARDPTFLLILLLNQIKKCMRVCVYDWMLFSSSRAHNEMLLLLLLYPTTRSTITPKSTRALDPHRILTRSSLTRTATLRVLPVCLNFIEFCFFPLFFSFSFIERS